MAPAPVAAPEPRFHRADRICPGLFAVEQLGSGRYCETWLAWSVPLWSHAVVKLPRDELMDDVGAARRLGREARTLRRLSHPGIQCLLEDAHWHPVPHLVLEHIGGPTLAALVRDQGPMPLADVVRVGMQVGSALHYLHGQGLVHLDVRAGNVVLRDGHAVLLDMDSARRPDQPPPPLPPREDRRHLAPELRSRRPVDVRMDLFALGATLYELATGRPPFVPETTGRGGHAAMPPRIRELVPSSPASLERAIHTLIEPEPELRPASALDALRLLARACPEADDAPWPDFAEALLPGRGRTVAGAGGRVVQFRAVG